TPAIREPAAAPEDATPEDATPAIREPAAAPEDATPAIREPAAAPEDATPATLEPAAAGEETTPAIREPAPSVVPKIAARVEPGAEGEECSLVIEALEHFPAYDPEAQQVVVVERYERKMTTSDFELVVRWFDASTGASLHREALVGCDDVAGAAAWQRRVDARLASGRFEAMEALPLRVVNDLSYENYRDLAATERDDRAVVEDFREELMPRGQVHAVAMSGGVVVRLPGVKVYEREITVFEVNTLHAVMAHRPSGTIALTSRECRDEEDCTCNLEDSTHVTRWSTATLDAIARHPCAPIDHNDDGCEIRSIFDG
ncbi:MAG: hypothetical protein KC486_23595, partial [Myxococcales bacterium]|nr:hypothetical protein [Myxococcales bacterium]